MDLSGFLLNNKKEFVVQPKLLDEIITEKSYEALVSMEVEELSEREFRTDVVYVTDLVYDCMRNVFFKKLFFWIKGLKMMSKTTVGKKLHEIQLLEGSEMEKEIEYEKIRGRIDEYDPESGIILEKKITFAKITRPYEHHIKQVQIYGWMAMCLGWNVRHLLISYFRMRNISTGLPYKTFEIPLKPIDEAKLFAKRDMILLAFQNNIIPKRNVCWMCRECPFAFLCFLDDEKLKEVVRRIRDAKIEEVFFKRSEQGD